MGDQKTDTQVDPSSRETEKMVAPPAKQRYNMYALGCTMLASLATILMGYDIGVMSGAQLFIQRDLKISDTQIEILTGILNLYSLVGSLASGFTSDRIGRRYTIVFAASIFFVGALLMGFATDYAFLMVGRFVAGIGAGYALVVAPTYTAEVAPASSRGFLTSLPEIFINVGILLGYVSNFAFARLGQSLGWRLMLGVGAIPSVFLGLGVLAMPESPRWLIMRGRLGEAKRVLEKISDSPEEARLWLADIKLAAGIPDECDDDVVAVPKEKRDNKDAWKDLLLRPTPAVRRVLITVAGVHFFQQASGIDSVVLYSPRVFEKAGIQGNNMLLGTTVAVGFTKTLFILVATFLLDRVGRRPLLLGSFAGMVLSLTALGIGLTAVDRHGGHLPWGIGLCITAILSYVAFFSIGAGPMACVYTSEAFPLRLRALGVSLAVVVNRVTSGVVSMTFISLYHAITLGGSFFMYAAIAVVGWVFFYALLLETRGRRLEEIEELFRKINKKGERKSGNGVERESGNGVEMVNN